MSTDKKLVVLGLDGATWRLLHPLMDRGYMPNLKKLVERGTHGKLESTIPAMTAPSWATFSTGKHPGHHGVFDFMLPINSLANMKVATSEDIRSKLIYEILKDNGKQPITINLPPAYPPRLTGSDDVTITCLLTQGDQWIFPQDLINEFPDLKQYRLTPNESLRVKERKDAYIEDLLRHLEEQVTCVKQLFEHKPWDFFFYLFSHSDWVSHLAYTDLEEQLAAAPRQIFERLDEHIQWFVDHLPEDADLIIVSDHGFKPYKKLFHFNRWLENEGYLTTTRDNEQFYVAATRRAKEKAKYESKKKEVNLGTGLFKTLAAVPGADRAARWVYHKIVKPWLPIKLNVKVGIDYSKTRVCFPKGSYVTNVYVNKAWVYDDGVVTREEYPGLIEELVQKISALRDPAGKPIVRRVMTREEVYPHGAPDTAPDLFFELDEYWLSGKFDSIRLCTDSEENKHEQFGIFLGVGPSFAEGKTIDGLKMQDMTPLMLHLFGLGVPSDCDGRMPIEALNADSPAAQRPIVSAPPSAWDPQTVKHTTVQHSALKERLKQVKIKL